MIIKNELYLNYEIKKKIDYGRKKNCLFKEEQKSFDIQIECVREKL